MQPVRVVPSDPRAVGCLLELSDTLDLETFDSVSTQRR